MSIFQWEQRVRAFMKGMIEPWTHAKSTESGGFKIHSRENDITIVGTGSNDVLKVMTGWNGHNYNHAYTVRMA